MIGNLSRGVATIVLVGLLSLFLSLGSASGAATLMEPSVWKEKVKLIGKNMNQKMEDEK